MKKVQYLIIDSEFVNGTNNNFSVSFDITSNTFIEDTRDVIGIKVVDFYVTQVGEGGDDGRSNQAKFIDIICHDVPTVAQMLSERTGQVLCRVPLERGFNGSSNFVVHDKQWKSFTRETKYFNPITIYKLNFELWEHQGDGDYVPLQPDAEFYMVLEITTRDPVAPPEDTNLRVVEAVEKLGKKFDRLAKSIQNPPPPPKQKIPVGYIVVILVLIAGLVYMFRRSTQVPAAAAAPIQGPSMQMPAAPPVPLRVPGSMPSRLM
jgi:hypothetical protein